MINPARPLTSRLSLAAGASLTDGAAWTDVFTADKNAPVSARTFLTEDREAQPRLFRRRGA